MKPLFFILIFLVANSGAKGQTDVLFSNVNQAQKLRLQNIFSEQRDSIFSQFDRAMSALMNSNDACHASPNPSNPYFLVNGLQEITDGQTLAYALMNNIVITSTGNMKVYSWDNLEGGPYHSYTSFIQTVGETGSCYSTRLNFDENDLEVGYYDIRPLDDDYIIFGFGTSGGGEQHFVVRIIHEDRGSITGIEKLNISSNRSQDVELKYHPKEKTISFRKYKWNEETGFHSNEFDTLTYFIENGKFIRK